MSSIAFTAGGFHNPILRRVPRIGDTTFPILANNAAIWVLGSVPRGYRCLEAIAEEADLLSATVGYIGELSADAAEIGGLAAAVSEIEDRGMVEEIATMIATVSRCH